MFKTPNTINIYNLKSFFDFKASGANQLKPGMIVQFRYRSPEGVHDVSPLIYVLEAEQDRVWGINVHYKLALLGEAVQIKKAEIQKTHPTQQKQEEVPIEPSEVSAKPRPEQLNQKHIPSLPEFKDTLKVGERPKGPEKKVVYPTQLLEHYTLTQQPKELLRNYLYSRMSSIQKLVFKTF